MDIEAVLRFVAENHHAVLATRRRDGSPQMSPVAVAADDGAVVISSRESAIKVKNLQRDNRASLCLLNDRFFGAWAQVEGPAEVVTLPEAMDGLIAYYRQISGEHPDWDEYRDAMQREKRVLIRVTPERAGPNVSG
jgi:PPOX class probable F420-dependent enzyme